MTRSKLGKKTANLNVQNSLNAVKCCEWRTKYRIVMYIDLDIYRILIMYEYSYTHRYIHVPGWWPLCRRVDCRKVMILMTDDKTPPNPTGGFGTLRCDRGVFGQCWRASNQVAVAELQDLRCSGCSKKPPKIENFAHAMLKWGNVIARTVFANVVFVQLSQFLSYLQMVCCWVWYQLGHSSLRFWVGLCFLPPLCCIMFRIPNPQAFCRFFATNSQQTHLIFSKKPTFHPTAHTFFSDFSTNKSGENDPRLAQGAKPGEGGELPGHKVWAWKNALVAAQHNTNPKLEHRLVNGCFWCP